ncbi:MAG: hypothetical protein L6R48_07170, partial [Planctomycetes bacterium]|nr:hypothetical protein [Planctomycetota bacterium]
TTPYWAATLKDGSRPARHDGYPPGWVPSDRTALAAYVRTTLEWFPSITTWEIWNEPNVAQFWHGTPQEYARLCQEVYTEAKRVRPELTVYVQFDAHGRWFHQAAEAGLLRWCDGVSYHAYASPGDHPQAGARAAAEVRAALAAHGRPDLPMINSEGGLTTTSFLRGIDHPRLLPESKRAYTYLAAAERLVQWRVVQMAAGVRAHFYYHLSPAGIDRDTGSGWSPVDVGGGPTPAAVAHGQLAWQLGGGSFARTLAAEPGLRCYLFQRTDASTCAVLWAEDGAGFRLTTAGQAFDLMGNPLAGDTLTIGATPVYLRLPGDAAQAASALAAASLTTVTPPSVATVVAMDPFPVANELGLARLHPLDLGALANLALAESPGAGRLVPGRHTWLGVPVAIGTGERALLALTPGATAAPLAVGRAVRGLFLCQAVDRAAGAAANWRVTYADGTVSDLTLGARELGAWDQDHQAGEDSRTVPLTGEGQPPRFLRLWYWENPRAQVPVTSLTVGNRSREATLVVAGVTTAIWK